jgi:hypothetical protein
MARRPTVRIQADEPGELAVVKLWLRYGTRTGRAFRSINPVKSSPIARLDYVLLDGEGVPAAYLEVKTRSTPFARFADVICPLTKHTFARKVAEKFDVPVYLVTEYACGTLVEVDLTAKPAGRRQIERRDRPGQRPWHAVYEGKQLKVLRRPVR